jgi:Large eukaryotic DNA virus major capsid protein/Major capsid protein N-terminus
MFKVVYRRHTNYAGESIEQTFQGNTNWGGKANAIISRNADLINRVYLQTTLPSVAVSGGSFRWIDDIGHHMIVNTKVEIGGQKIDEQSGDWLQIYGELTVAAGHRDVFRRMIGNRPLIHPADNVVDTYSLQALNNDDKPETTVYTPFRFWFCRNVGLSLPLIALQYHEVRIEVQFRQASDCYITEGSPTLTGVTTLGSTSLWIDYIYLDTDERRRFAQVSHEYLIEQVQFTGEKSISSASTSFTQGFDLNFNHPTKELVWVVQHDDAITNKQYSNYTDSLAEDDENCRFPRNSANPVSSAKLQLNGHDRFAARDGEYFNWVQTYEHHTHCPESPGINVYSFALKPEEHQPSGSLNFSRIDSALLNLTISYTNAVNPDLDSVSAKLRIYAVNYNVFRVMSGMGGLAYSN